MEQVDCKCRAKLLSFDCNSDSLMDSKGLNIVTNYAQLGILLLCFLQHKTESYVTGFFQVSRTVAVEPFVNSIVEMVPVTPIEEMSSGQKWCQALVTKYLPSLSANA